VGFTVKIRKVKYGPNMFAVTAGVNKEFAGAKKVKRPVWKLL
jgi:hypothetical protein